MARRLSDGRLHLQHGPIDLVILGTEDEYERATTRFGTVLEELVQELAQGLKQEQKQEQAWVTVEGHHPLDEV